MRRAFQQLGNEPCVKRMPGPVSDEAAQHRLSDQREIAEQVEDLMANEFVRKSQGSVVEHAGLRQYSIHFTDHFAEFLSVNKIQAEAQNYNVE